MFAASAGRGFRWDVTHTSPAYVLNDVTLNTKELRIGLLLIVVGLIADFGASYLLPTPKACYTAECNAAEVIGFAALLMLIIGVVVQLRALWNTRPQLDLPPGFRPGSTPSDPLFGVPAGSASDRPTPWAPTAIPSPGTLNSPGAGASAPTVRCRRCDSAYPAGQFSYCSKCGNPLPFSP